MKGKDCVKTAEKRGSNFYGMCKIAKALQVGKERYFDSKIELYAISQKFSRASYNIPISHSAGFQSGTKYWKTSRKPH